MAEVMTAEEAAEYLRTSVGTIRRLARRGDLPASRVGGKWRFRKDEIDDWFATGGSEYEELVDEGLRLAIEEAKANVAVGRSKLIPWEEAEAEPRPVR